MGVNFTLQANVRKTAPQAFASGIFGVDQNARGDLCVAASLPPYTELARLGNGWSTRTPVANAFQPVAAMPTTLANVVLYNGYSSKALVIDSTWATTQTSIAAGTSFTLLAQISNAGVAAPTDNTALLITSLAGKTYSGSAKRAIANTAFAIADKWTVVGQSSGHPSTAIGAGARAEFLGRWVVPPGACFCCNLVASTAGGTMIQGVDWYELDLDLA